MLQDLISSEFDDSLLYKVAILRFHNYVPAVVDFFKFNKENTKPTIKFVRSSNKNTRRTSVDSDIIMIPKRNELFLLLSLLQLRACHFICCLYYCLEYVLFHWLHRKTNEIH